MARASTIPPEALLERWPPPIREHAMALRALVRQTVPDAIERVRPGWGLIGYDLAIAAKRTVFFAWVQGEAKHAHLGFRQGVAMVDPDRRLSGHGITLQARWLTYEPGDEIEPAAVIELIHEAVRVARLPPAERMLLSLEHDGMDSRTKRHRPEPPRLRS